MVGFRASALRSSVFGQGAELFSRLIDLRYQLKPLRSHDMSLGAGEITVLRTPLTHCIIIHGIR